VSEVTHNQIYSRLSETEERIMATEGRIMAMIKWLATGFAGIALSALAWGYGERMKQVDLNAVYSGRFGESAARQDEIGRRLDEISALIKSESELTREKIISHAADSRAHERR
jgi:hypothetical protein